MANENADGDKIPVDPNANQSEKSAVKSKKPRQSSKVKGEGDGEAENVESKKSEVSKLMGNTWIGKTWKKLKGKLKESND
jgi:hypothetical protein